ncbi:MAG: hypothetical protein NVSMB18_23440 [Acetobacteraceae bacterium]
MQMPVDTLVRFDTNFGSFLVELYDGLAPITVGNFLTYVSSNSYTSSFFHRLVPGFVLQGGGYTDTAANGIQTIPANAAIANEYNPNLPDVAQTIAMAKLGGNPNSATDQFFFNLVDNTTTLGPSNNGGFAVFGRVVQGWSVVQAMAALPTHPFAAPFDQLPVNNYSSGPVSPSNLAFVQDVVPAGYSALAGLSNIATLGNGAVLTLNSPASTVRVHALAGAAGVSGFQPGAAIDLLGVTGATLSGTTVTTSTGSIALTAAPAGSVYKLYGDANGGTDILLNPTSPPAGAVAITDATTSASSVASGDDYTGPVDYLQRQYIYAGTDNVAIAANVSNAFLKGGPGGDALQAKGGNNILDGGGGSNFLIGGTGADGGRDTFFVDARDPGVVTWSTIVNFHQGDQATIFGFHPNLSTRPFTASDGAAGYTGGTIHSEINGPGSGVLASMTFAGIDPGTVQQHFVFSAGTLPGNIDYLLIQYT